MKLLLVLLNALPLMAMHLTEVELEQLYGRAPQRRVSLKHVTHGVGANQTLREAAEAKGIFIGTASNCGYLKNASDPMYTQLQNLQFDIATAENSCKFAATEPSQNAFDYSCCAFVADNMIKTANGTFRGHNFVWGTYNPSWLLQHFTPAQLTDIMRNHISTLGGHFAPSFYSWDVVNEAVSDDSNPTVILKDAAPWYPAIPTYVDIAFVAARQAMPTTKLFYNDYGGEGLGVKSDKIYNLLASMKSRGIPVDGVGLQMHISVDSYPAPADVTTNIKRLAALGLEVHITEMDVRCSLPCGADRLALQAQIYGDMLSACLASPGCKSFETWGFTDRYTWLWDFNNPNHQNLQPLPFDINYNPKPAYYELLATLQS